MGTKVEDSECSIVRVTICPVLAKTVLDFRGWFLPAVRNYNGYPGNTGVSSGWELEWCRAPCRQAHSPTPANLWEWR